MTYKGEDTNEKIQLEQEIHRHLLFEDTSVRATIFTSITQK